jgi:hypothetical protein
VGRRSDAVALYQRRKTDARMGIKMPEVRPRRAVLFSEIAADALAYSKEHKASYPGDCSTVNKLLPVFGTTAIDDITPQMIKAYLDKRDDLTKTTINRYRGTLSMVFAKDKVFQNFLASAGQPKSCSSFSPRGRASGRTEKSQGE